MTTQQPLAKPELGATPSHYPSLRGELLYETQALQKMGQKDKSPKDQTLRLQSTSVYPAVKTSFHMLSNIS